MENIDTPADFVPKYVFLKPKDIADTLTRNQLRALNVMRGVSRCKSDDAKKSLLAKTPDADLIAEYIAYKCPITINVSNIVLEKILADDKFKNVFEVSEEKVCKGENYLRARRKWEQKCFDNLYDFANSDEKVKYGALNFTSTQVSGAKSYGEVSITLKNLRNRCTIAGGDTFGNTNLGVLEYCNHILVQFTKKELSFIASKAAGENPPLQNFSGYKEIQIHGDVIFSKHVEKVVGANESNKKIIKDKYKDIQLD